MSANLTKVCLTSHNVLNTEAGCLLCGYCFLPSDLGKGQGSLKVWCFSIKSCFFTNAAPICSPTTYTIV